MRLYGRALPGRVRARAGDGAVVRGVSWRLADRVSPGDRLGVRDVVRDVRTLRIERRDPPGVRGLALWTRALTRIPPKLYRWPPNPPETEYIEPGLLEHSVKVGDYGLYVP